MTEKRRIASSDMAFLNMQPSKIMVLELKEINISPGLISRALMNYLICYDKIPPWLNPYLTKRKQAEIRRLYPGKRQPITVSIKREKLIAIKAFEEKHNINRQELVRAMYYYFILNKSFPNDALFYEIYVKNEY